MFKIIAMLSFFIILSTQLLAEWKPLIYKPLAENTVHLKVLRVINPRFPMMNENQFKLYLKEAKNVVLEHFGVHVVFEVLKKQSIKDFFTVIPVSVKEELYKDIYDFKNNRGDEKLLVKNIADALAAYSKTISLSDLMDYANPHLVRPIKKRTLYSLAEALIDTEIKRLKMWTEVQASDNQSVINDDPYNEWALWDAVGHFKTDFDVVLTNQLIASAEYYGQDMHSALRGGIVAGTTSYMKDSPFDAFVFVTSFLFINDHSLIKKLRGNKVYSKRDAAIYSGAYLAHEIGHMLFRLSHPFNKQACVMNPAKLLYFETWYKEIDAKKCPIGSSESMNPGSATLYYNDAW